MLVYNIRREKYAASLIASGIANRWNKKDEFVIYTGSSISLAALEMIAHRSGILLSQPYRLLTIHLNVNENDITTFQAEQLPSHWKSIEAYSLLQSIGSEWYHSKKTLLLKVPSVLIPKEFNFLINIQHPDFEGKVKLVDNEPFIWDERLM